MNLHRKKRKTQNKEKMKVLLNTDRLLKEDVLRDQITETVVAAWTGASAVALVSFGGGPPPLARKGHDLVCVEVEDTHPQVVVVKDLLDLADLYQHPVLGHVLVLDGTAMTGLRTGLGSPFLHLRTTNNTEILIHKEGEDLGITHGQVHDHRWDLSRLDQGRWDQSQLDQDQWGKV